MGNVSIRWRMLVETSLLVILIASASLLFGVIGTILAGILALIAVVFLSLHLTNQFAEVTDGVIRATSIEPTHRLDPAGPAELARIARAVNRLMDRVGEETAEDFAERIRLASILDSMQEGVVVVDDQGIIESANPASIEMLLTAGDVEPGMQLSTLTNHPDVINVINRSIEGDRTVSAEIELFDNSRILRAVSTPFPRPETGAVRALIILTDLTDVRRLDTTRREFVSNASHELRTPVAGIRASAETLQRGAAEDPEGREQFLKMIRQDVDRMDKLITEMLELSRLESGESPLELELVSPSKLVDDSISQFMAVATETDLKLESTVPHDLPEVSVDPEKIGHVFTNLISNAVKWTPPGGVITLNSWVDERSIWFTVSDTGQGIEPEHLPHIFERFFKTDPARTQPGTGLGLAIVRHLVDAHGGAISASSTIGEGSEFAFAIPLGRS